MMLKAEQLTKWQLFSLKMTTSTISSEIDVILCICSACINIYFLEMNHVLIVTTPKNKHRNKGSNRDFWHIWAKNSVISDRFSIDFWPPMESQLCNWTPTKLRRNFGNFFLGLEIFGLVCYQQKHFVYIF